MALHWNCVDNSYPVLEWSCLECYLLSLGLFSELHGGAEEQRRSIFWVSGNGPGISYMSLHLLYSPSNLLDCELLCPFYRWEDRALSDWPQSVLPSVSHRTEYQTQTHIPCLLHLPASGSMNPLHATASAGSLSASGLSLVLWVLSYGQAWHNCQGARRLRCHMGMSVVRSRTSTRRKGEFSLVLWCLWPEAWGESRTGERIRGLPLLSAVGAACALYCLGCCQFDNHHS